MKNSMPESRKTYMEQKRKIFPGEERITTILIMFAQFSNFFMPFYANPCHALVQVWQPGVDGVDEDEQLQFDPTAYDCLHAFSLGWPCLR